jgi:hypothetical protein
MARVGGLTGADLKHLHGHYDLGWNATGVIRSHLHVDADEIIIREEMPGAVVDEIMAEVAAFADRAKRRKGGMELVGKIPLPIYVAWRKQWERGPRLHGVLWRAFLESKLLDRDYSRFRVKR